MSCGEADAEDGTDGDVGGGYGHAEAAGDDDEEEGDHVGGESLSFVEGGNFFAHGVGYFFGLEDAACGHEEGDEEEAVLDSGSFGGEECSDDLGGVVESTGKADAACAQVVNEVEGLSGADAEAVLCVVIAFSCLQGEVVEGGAGGHGRIRTLCNKRCRVFFDADAGVFL